MDLNLIHEDIDLTDGGTEHSDRNCLGEESRASVIKWAKSFPVIAEVHYLPEICLKLVKSVFVSNIVFRNKKIIVRTSKTDTVKNGSQESKMGWLLVFLLYSIF